MTSILTDISAMVDLQTLKSVNSHPGKDRADIATGEGVADAKDNAAVRAMSRGVDAERSTFKTIQPDLDVADAVLSTAREGAERILASLRAIKDPVAGACDIAAAREKAKIPADIDLRVKETTSVTSGTQMNGVALPKSGGDDLKVLASLDRGTGPTITRNPISRATAGLDPLIGTLDIVSTAATFGETDILTAASLDSSADGTTHLGRFVTLIETAISKLLEKTAALCACGTQPRGQAPSASMALLR